MLTCFRFMIANCFQIRSFSCILMDPSNYQLKIHQISRFVAKCYVNVLRSAPDVEITMFSKVLPNRAQNVFSLTFSNFCRVRLEDFVDFARFHVFCAWFSTLQDRKLLSNPFIFLYFDGPEQFSTQNQ